MRGDEKSLHKPKNWSKCKHFGSNKKGVISHVLDPGERVGKGRTGFPTSFKNL